MQDVKATMAHLDQTVVRIEATLNAVLPHLATKAELGHVEASIGKVEADVGKIETLLTATLPHLATKAELADKPGKAYLWGVLAVLITAYGAGLAALAVLK